MATSRLIRFTSRDIFTNLAAEELLFQRTSGHTLLFYVNTDSVVLGRTQNPFKECDVAHAASQGVSIARRRSGGGTVVHDSGNLNFSFIRPRAEHEPYSNARLVANVLKDEFGINAEVNKRADITVDGYKVSGAAYRLSGDRAYHHGTLLLNSNLDKLRRLLKSPLAPDIKALGAASVRSPVTNLSNYTSRDLNIDTVISAIAERFTKTNENISIMTPAIVEREIGGMQAERDEICSHSWVYGKTPSFSYTFQMGPLQLTLQTKKGTVLQDVQVEITDPVIDSKTVSEVQGILQDRLSGHIVDGPSLASLITNYVDSHVSQPKSLFASQLLTNIATHMQHSLPCPFWNENPDGSSEMYNEFSDLQR